ncbi:AAA-type ATPase family protein [Actinidia rufa]|uniref:AAA-type ATPase family protein n=1 Tax=Actinidia rufa TaxID=165716 RepID=A0A7J0HAR0_9ERIC|nr:AAA-type ATPase family protein [Actinidia rufa]
MHLLTEVPCTPHRDAPQSTSLCETSWLHLSFLVCTTGEITATNQIESERDSFRALSRLSLYSSFKLILSPSSELFYGHPALVAPLLSGQTCTYPKASLCAPIPFWILQVHPSGACLTSVKVTNLSFAMQNWIVPLPTTLRTSLLSTAIIAVVAVSEDWSCVLYLGQFLLPVLVALAVPRVGPPPGRVEDTRLLPPERVGRVSESRSDAPNFRWRVEAGPAFIFYAAVANSTSATFLRVVGSELIQKYLGDGPKLVRELFRVADDLSPSIVFIDEIDAIGTKRYDAHSGGEREIQRTMLELLNQLDGFDSRGDVKVILATNKIESLDPALLRPGRIDRKIEFPLPDIKTRRRIFQIHTSRMTLADDVNLEEFVMTKDEFSGADIKAICTEAGLLALRERRMKVTHPDFKKAKDKVMFKKKEGVPEGLYM